MGVTAVLLLLATRIWQHFDRLATLPFRWNPQHILLGGGLALGITALSAVIYQLWPQYRASATIYLQLVIKPLTWSDLLWLGLLPGLSEELLFRGVMLPALGLNLTGLVLSSLCFGILHLNGLRQWSYVVWVTVVGLLLGYSTLATGNLLVPVTAHVLANIITGLSWKITHPAR
ncbi:MAG: CPBP family intramembrane metalloprotease [Acaryochloridaceae cyanobacterium SU_2_1]|nr:CPBP family intramembrane metalloprotease [Acaryochloridaceae cyanobacterium SU_2_1]NJM95059.1 CPBP family intramembrane metalloprotease [Acaryochloridaceae cyanobacterium CSU_5_19]